MKGNRALLPKGKKKKRGTFRKSISGRKEDYKREGKDGRFPRKKTVLDDTFPDLAKEGTE